jgi:hypothetical protein
MIDNGHTAMDELMGNIIVAIGRDALGNSSSSPRIPRPLYLGTLPR